MAHLLQRFLLVVVVDVFECALRIHVVQKHILTLDLSLKEFVVTLIHFHDVLILRPLILHVLL